MFWICHSKKCFEVRTDGPSHLSHVSRAAGEVIAQSRMAAIMLRDRILGYIPMVYGGPYPVTNQFESRSHARKTGLPATANTEKACW